MPSTLTHVPAPCLQPAVSPVFQPASRPNDPDAGRVGAPLNFARLADWKVGDTAGWKACATSVAARAGAGCLVFFALSLPVFSASIVTTKHNLSVSGPGPVKAVTESQVCIFCHVPHSRVGQTPLWNRYDSEAMYEPYRSSTAGASPGQPTGASKLCLSCHDGTVALGLVRSRTQPIEMQSGATVMPPGKGLLGVDLADDHPLSFTFDAALAAADGQLRDPATLVGSVRLDHNQQLQCTACHNPHDDRYGKFLVRDNYGSALCVTCHNKAYWTDAIHCTGTGGHSSGTWNGVPPNPWPHTSQTTVAANACENCHAPHHAGTKPRLLTFAGQEQNCFACHNGNVARNVQSEFSKLSAHPVLQTGSLHDPTEDAVDPPRHVTCADCHNPHATKAACIDCHPQHGPPPATASGLLRGVKGVNASGSVVQAITYRYELCFRCHADSADRGPAHVTRQYVQTNARLEFSPGNLSYHPIETTGRNASVPSLISPYTVSALINCTSCHNNDQGLGAGGRGPTGPHGSAYAPLLERRLEWTDFQTESSAIYALCYKCHSRSSLLANRSFPKHKEHIQDARTACTTCHDPHGVAQQAHLINFNTLYVTPSSGGQLRFLDNGTFHGTCYLTCHGKDHNPESY
ncbi:MAG: hypothetical protein HZA90_10725 [Verrucomicrobia bacterium]|nr:hypothetical protein [Verrucomicrobiota bacterium]